MLKSVFLSTALLCYLLNAPLAVIAGLDDYRSLVQKETWNERWPTEKGEWESRTVTAELWRAAIQAALEKENTVYLPYRKEPYYLDGPLILQSGDTFKAAPKAEIRLIPGCNTCMIRNKNIIGFADKAVPDNLQFDTDISIEGGIWTTLATGKRENNGNVKGASSKKNSVPGTHGVILLHNVRRVSVKNVTIRQSKPFAVHLGNIKDFLVDGVTLDRHRRDGVHVSGPASQGVLRNIRGDSHDDTVSLTAWDWRQCAPSFGAIHHLVVENIIGAPDEKNAADAIRLLPGVKQFTDGSRLNCPVHDIVIRNVTNIREFKFYDQPNLEHGRDNDFSVELGKLRNISMQHLRFTRPGYIQIAAEVSTLTIDDVDLRFPLSPTYRLVQIGPMSQTYRHDKDPKSWVEIFSPDRDVTVRDFHLSKVTCYGKRFEEAEKKLVEVKDQKINRNYPQTVPRGGTGKAFLLP